GCGDRRAEHRLRWRENLDAAAARARPPVVLRGHAADGDQSVELLAERRRKTIDDSFVAAAVVGVVARDDEEEVLAVRIGIAVRVDAADHRPDLLLDGGVRDGT